MAELLKTKSLIWVAGAALTLRTIQLCLAVADEPGGLIRAILGTAFCLLILYRSQAPREAEADSDEDSAARSTRMATVMAVVSSLAVVGGLILHIRQVEWLGMLMLTYAAGLIALPRWQSKTLARALFVLYWINPLPGQIEGAARLTMQRLSTSGAEWLLHIVNLPAWADGLVLQTAATVVEIPQACSGMRTAITVLMCALGIALVFGFKRREMTLFALLGVAQGLIMNAARIALVAKLSGEAEAANVKQMIHDSTGILMIAAVLLLQTEAAVWHRLLRRQWLRYRQRKREGRRWCGTAVNVAYRLLGFGFVALLIACVAYAGYKRRPSHRAAMIVGVIENAGADDLESAQRAAMRAIEICPEHEAANLALVRILLARGKHTEALNHLDTSRLEAGSLEAIVLRAATLAESDRLDEAARLLSRLPPDQRQHPIIAMTLAQIALRNDNLSAVKPNLQLASRDRFLAARVRACFPYLAARGQWQTIVDSDPAVPHHDAALLRTALTAHLLLCRFNEAHALMAENRTLWETDPSFLQPLATLAMRSGNDTWREVFAQTLSGTIDQLSAEQLIEHAETCLKMELYTVAWEAILCVQKRDSEHPGPFLLAAVLPREWAKLPTFMSPSVPQQNDDRTMTREELLNTCLTRIAAKSAAGQIPRPMAMMRVRVYAMLGQYDDAQHELDRIEKDYAGENGDLVPRRAGLYYAQQRWDRAYELLRQTDAATATLDLPTREMLVRSALQLGLGLPALIYAEDSAVRLPTEARTAALLAQVWSRFGFHEDALFILDPDGKAPPSPGLAVLLEKTGRIIEADTMRRRLGIDEQRKAERLNPSGKVPPAERVMQWVAPPAPTKTEPIVASFRNHAERTVSPYVKRLHEQTAAWYAASKPPDPTTALKQWAAFGRDPLERAAALDRLARLQTEAGDKMAALGTVERAIEILPGAALLWRMRVALTGGDEAVVLEASDSCPNDPVLWLARLVNVVRGEAPQDTVDGLVASAVTRGAYSPGTFVRAGNFLLKNGYESAAVVAARHAQDHARGFLPAHSLAMQCAETIGDPVWAMQSALQAADMAIGPTPYLRAFARTAMKHNPDDPALVTALQTLVKTPPNRPQWRERLAAVLFRRGDYRQAQRVLAPLAEPGRYAPSPGMAIVAAESHRRTGAYRAAVGILVRALTRHPESVSLLNNLIFTLQENESTRSKALELLPRLLRHEPSASLHDTAALVYRRSGMMDEAVEQINNALILLKEDDPSWPVIMFHAFELAEERGDENVTEKLLTQLRDSGKTDGLTTAEVRRIGR